MALRKLKAQHIRYICWRVVDENKTNAYLKAFGGSNRNSASVLSARLERNSPIIPQEIAAGKVARQEAIQRKTTRQFREHQAKIEEDRARTRGLKSKEAERNLGYDTTMSEDGMPPANSHGKTYKGHPIIDNTPPPRRGRSFRFDTKWDPFA